MSRSLAIAALSASLVAAQGSFDLFVPGAGLPGLEGPGSIVSESPEVTAIALGGGAVTVQQGPETFSYSADGTAIACRLDIPEDTANCEWDTPATSITGDLPSIGAMFVPIEITAGGEGGGDATSTSASAPAPTSTSDIGPIVTESWSSSEDDDCTDVTSAPVPSSSSVVVPTTFSNSTVVPTSCGGCSGGGDSSETPAPTEPAPSGTDGGEQPPPSEVPAAAPKAVLNGLLAGAAVFVAGALAL